MFYRPNFCCSCGEKIERVEWTIFSSRKFCDLCQTEFRARDLGPKIFAAVVLTVFVAVVSSVFRPAQSSPKVISQETLTSSSWVNSRAEGNFNTTSNHSEQSQTGANINAATVAVPPANPSKPAAVAKAAEPIYYCGASTKKGTPCSRRVKRPGERCWQHQGMPSVMNQNEETHR